MLSEVEGDRSSSGATTSARLRRVASQAPDRPAVIVDDVVTTYGELDRLADELAAALVGELGLSEHRVG
ncbi:MAG: hypothetical protein ACRDZX_08575, partial [Acidimicrobiales bacterium]